MVKEISLSFSIRFTTGGWTFPEKNTGHVPEEVEQSSGSLGYGGLPEFGGKGPYSIIQYF